MRAHGKERCDRRMLRGLGRDFRLHRPAQNRIDPRLLRKPRRAATHDRACEETCEARRSEARRSEARRSGRGKARHVESRAARRRAYCVDAQWNAPEQLMEATHPPGHFGTNPKAAGPAPEIATWKGRPKRRLLYELALTQQGTFRKD